VRGIIAIFCLVLALMSLATELCAQQLDDFNAEKMSLRDQSYKSGWFINPQPITAKNQPIKLLEPFQSTDMFPYKAYTIENSFAVEKLQYDAPAKTEFVGLIAHYPMGCTAKPIGKTATQTILLKSGTVFLCLVDSDKNGAFDKYFTTKLVAIGSIPDTAQSIPELRYTEIDPKSSSLVSKLWLYLRYAKKQTVQIGFHYSKEDKVKNGLMDLLANEVLFYEFKSKSLPLKFRIFGTQYQVDEIGNGSAKIIVESQLPIAPIHLGENCCY
jgi:hypothetical protein